MQKSKANSGQSEGVWIFFKTVFHAVRLSVVIYMNSPSARFNYQPYSFLIVQESALKYIISC